ncbi:unnamed protein product, partial [Vitis vinifera]|uniref:Uncharacterized protein n=1 Tax=Vitis vinifera TaxID=29760 RepID=D7TNV8_VITVI
MQLPSLNSKNSDQWSVILMKMVLHQYTVSNKDQHRRHTMRTMFDMTMEKYMRKVHFESIFDYYSSWTSL